MSSPFLVVWLSHAPNESVALRSMMLIAPHERIEGCNLTTGLRVVQQKTGRELYIPCTGYQIEALETEPQKG